MNYVSLCLSTLGVALVPLIWKAFVTIIWRPLSITRRLRKQGVKGPDFSFYSGNVDEITSLKMEAAAKEMDTESNDITKKSLPHYVSWTSKFGNVDEITSLKMEAAATEMDTESNDITQKSLPHYVRWTSKYGEVFLYWFGLQPRICITDIELIRQILSDKSGSFTKAKGDPRLIALIGRGLFFLEGEEWDKRRKLIIPAFTMNKLKGMTNTMVGCTATMLDKWEALIKKDATIEVQKHFVEITTDMITHTVFGSSFDECREIFFAQKELINDFLASFHRVQIPGLGYIPTKSNRRKWELQRKVRGKFVSIIQKRLSSKSGICEDDLLDLLIESSKNQKGTALSVDDIIAECQNFFLGGQGTTAQLITWTIFVLSRNQEWQEKLRNEVFGECGMEPPTSDNLSHLKMMHMVLLETLRLYCPVTVIGSQNAREVELGGITLPKDTMLTIPIPIIHRKKELWGEDANEFNPMRFENGVLEAAKHPNALLAFALGPRVCIGRNFSTVAAKTVVAMILQRFTFVLSPDYKHMPTDIITLQALFGLPVVFSPIK